MSDGRASASTNNNNNHYDKLPPAPLGQSTDHPKVYAHHSQVPLPPLGATGLSGHTGLPPSLPPLPPPAKTHHQDSLLVGLSAEYEKKLARMAATKNMPSYAKVMGTYSSATRMDHYVILNALMLANPANATAMTVYRGVPPQVDVEIKTSTRANKWGAFATKTNAAPTVEASLQSGDQVVFARLLSTSHRVAVPFSFLRERDPSDYCSNCCMLRFELPAGYPRLFLEPYTAFTGEDEFLLPAYVLRDPKRWQALFEQHGAWSAPQLFQAVVERFWDIVEPARFVVKKVSTEIVPVSHIRASMGTDSRRAALLSQGASLELQRVTVRTLVPINGF